MKRVIRLFTLLLLGILLTGCNNDSNIIENKKEQSMDNQEDIKDKEEKIEDPIIENKDFVGITFDDYVLQYDGENHHINCDNVPSFATVEYSNNDKVKVGEYIVTATITAEGYNTLTMNATMTIMGEFEDYDFKDVTVPYDGKNHTIKLENIPSYCKATYVGTKNYTSPGSYTITVVLSAKYYHDKTFTATLTIQPLQFEGLQLDSASYLQDGISHKLEVVGAPKDAIIEYKCTNHSGTNSFTEAGLYQIKATVSKENYQTVSLTAELEIESPNAAFVDNEKEQFKFDDTLKWDDLYNELKKGNFTIEVQFDTRFDYNDGSVRETKQASGFYAYDVDKVYTSYVPNKLSKYDQPLYTYERIVQDSVLLTKVYYVQGETAEIMHSLYNKEEYFENLIQKEIDSDFKCLTKSQEGGFEEGSYFSSVTYYGSYEIKENCFIIRTINNYYHTEGTNHELVTIVFKNIGNTKVVMPKCIETKETDKINDYRK